MYRYVLIDNDNTLMNFTAAEYAAIRETLTEAGLPSDDAACETYARVNDGMWKALERGELTQDELRVRRFDGLLKELGAEGDPRALCRLYEYRLGCHAELLPGAVELLKRLRAAGCRIALVSNGIGVIQRSRLSRSPFLPLLDAVFISGEETTGKPDPAVVTESLRRLRCADNCEAVFLGDSLTADIACAHNAGIASVLFSPKGLTDDRAACCVRTLEEAGDFILR